MKLSIRNAGLERCVEIPEGTSSAGSGPLDEVTIPEIPERFLRLHREGERLMVEGARVFSIDGVMVPPRVARLLLPGERVELPGGVVLSLPVSGEQKAAGTVAVLQQFLTEPDAEAGATVPRLLCLTGLDVGMRFPLCDGTTSIGRGEEMNARIRDRAVSRRHARVFKLADGFAVEDAGTSNGVYVNGARINGRVRLTPGDIVELGHTLLRFDAPVPEAAPVGTAEVIAESARGAAPPSVAEGSAASSVTTSVGASPERFGWTEWLMIAGGAALTVLGLAVSLTLLR